MHLQLRFLQEQPLYHEVPVSQFTHGAETIIAKVIAIRDKVALVDATPYGDHVTAVEVSQFQFDQTCKVVFCTVHGETFTYEGVEYLERESLPSVRDLDSLARY